MKRHPALVPLSDDHHHGLVQARRLRLAAEAGDVDAAARGFAAFFERETLRHFREEEQLFPLAPEEAHPLVERLLAEHAEIRALVEGLPATAAEAAALLERHIRAEERELFPLVEASSALDPG